MQNILIIKTAATGDVVRTTVLLHVLKDNIYWVTDVQNIFVFPADFSNLRLIDSENFPTELYHIQFDLIINLEESISLAQRISSLRFKKFIGVYWNNNALDYTPDSAPWFDMSLISKLGEKKANELKKQNTKTYQDLLFAMLNIQFSGEPYVIFRTPINIKKNIKIGIETRTGARWPNKGWHGYDELKQILLRDGFEVINFEQRNNVRDYFRDIDQCTLIITGDTLAMHVAIGYAIPCIAIFNCTSPDEIYDYDVLQKIISPMLEKVFYNTHYFREATRAVSIDEVLNAVYPRLQANATGH